MLGAFMNRTESNTEVLNYAFDYSFSIVELKKLILELDNACLHSEVNSSADKYADIVAKTQKMEFYLEKLNVWAKNKFIEIIK
jgi:hypothetical protein